LKSGLTSILATAIQAAMAVPCLSKLINFLHGLTTKKLGANLIQAQRDYSGANAFQRIDAESGQFFHHRWVR
jgi:6-phosphogluconate dehydrogenase